MVTILNIDTAIDTAYIGIARDGEIIAGLSNGEQKDHAGFLQPAIQTLLKNTSISMKELDAVAVSAGPGSYTGLRVGMASAKGLCYALNIPLITIGTLEILAFAAQLQCRYNVSTTPLFCPMIDARRMEVFTALYDARLQPVSHPVTMILDKSSFANFLLKDKIYFFGNGAVKWAAICDHKNAVFIDGLNNSLAMNKLAYKKYEGRDFADLAYIEPYYLKDFFSGTSNH